MKERDESKHAAATEAFLDQVQRYGRHPWNLDLSVFGKTAKRIAKCENRSIHLAQLNR